MRVLVERSQSRVASPRLLQELGVPQAPAGLARFPSLDMGVPQQAHVWRLFGPDGAQVEIAHRPRFVTQGMLALRDAALAGAGMVQLPQLMIGTQLADGTLRRVLPEWQPRRGIVHAMFASRRGQLPAVRALIDYLAQRFDRVRVGQAPSAKPYVGSMFVFSAYCLPVA